MDGFSSGGAKHGLEAALSYYVECGTPYFALYMGKPTARGGNVVMHNWGGRIEDIDEAANRIRDRFADTGIDDRTRYTLAWWDERPKMSKGTPDEPAGGSVVFVMATSDQIMHRREDYRAGMAGVNAEIISRLSAIEARMNEPEDDDEEEPTPSASEQMIGAVMNNPAVMSTIIQGIMSAFRLPGAPLAPPAPAAVPPSSGVKLAGVETEAPEPGALVFDTDTLNEALIILKSADPDLEQHLMKLAEMAQSNPAQFKWLLKML